MVDRVATLNTLLPGEWAARNGLRFKSGFVPSGLNGLVDNRRAGMADALKKIDRDYELTRALLDHPRTFTKPGGNSAVVVITAPYERAALGHCGGPGEVVARVHELAQTLGLAVRVGNPSDLTYLSNIDADPTLPIVWWQPSRIALPYPPLSDPNPDFASRMATS